MITIDWSAITKTEGLFRVTLRSCPNPDFGEILPRKGPSSAQGTLLEVVVAAHSYSSGLGGGNWCDPIIYRQYGRCWKRFARMSYNGRLWPPAAWHPGMKAVFEVEPTNRQASADQHPTVAA